MPEITRMLRHVRKPPPLRNQFGLTKVEWVFLLIIVVAMALFLTWMSFRSDKVRRDMKAAASPVFAALAAYHSKNGAYPESLDQLIPAYLPASPTCDGKRKMGYSAGVKPGT